MYLAALLVVVYAVAAFAVFLIASLLYRRRRVGIVPEAVIVLGAGLIAGAVPPLLEGRLRRALDALRSLRPTPVLITSGGQGEDEPRPESVAMRELLIEWGAEPEQILIEAESRSTRENLEFSRRLLSSPETPVLIVTSSYHVFRAALLSRKLGMTAHVVGSPTSWFYLPSALLREFAGVLRDQLRIHLIIVSLLVVVTVGR